ncbi:MAG: DUF6177 family protein [Pseudolysinimonas sp.]|uniref:DUF6177 family protein n=1 Tax=Pseudolysinimonas sp. TaxID=2680009 RepID=UPI003263DA11
MLTGFTHPLVDHVDGLWACVESRADTVLLTESMADALVAIQGAGLTPVVITRPGATMSYLARYHLTLAGGRWLVRESASAFVDPLTGVVSDRIDRALEAAAPSYDQSTATGDVRFLVAISTQSPADESTELGETAVTLAKRLASTQLACWGAHEPATLSWNRKAYTAASRAWMPGPVRWMIADTDGRARFTTTIRRTKGGVEETTTGILLAAKGSTADLTATAVEVLTRIATATASPLFGTVAMQSGPVDLGFRPEPIGAATPLAAIIGPRATKALAPNLDELSRDFGAKTVGRGRTPSLVVGFDSPTELPYSVATRFTEALGTDKITRLLSRSGGTA